ncbi:condensation domain-containing protein [Streptomyces sp. URMC 127]|uniref:condensation domain-containing protein n=1 Tax=Streptomyces sp. URMC 127 TaxID=3423402 RepID=UPI003F1C6445
MIPAPEELPSSPAQEALWWIQHRAERKDLYNLTWRLRVTRLDPAALATAWQLVVDRHEALRTGFVRRGDAVVQLIHATAEATLQEVAWDEPPAGRTPEALLDEVAAQFHSAPFDLESVPLARLALVTAGPVEELLVTVHHSILDGWALQLVMDDLKAAYEAALERGPQPDAAAVFPEAAVPYREFGQQTRTGAAQAGSDRAFWTGQLRGVKAAALVPDGPERPGTRSSGAALRHRLPDGAQAAVAAVAQRVGCTAFAVQLAAVRTVLARGGASGRTALGVVVANRMSAEDQRRVGYCANTVLLADAVTDDEGFDDVVGRTRDGLWESLPYQHVSFSEVFAELSAEDRAALGSTPPVLITHHGGIGSGLSLGHEPARLLPSPSTSARCQLLVGIFEEGEHTVLEIEYDTDQLRESTVRAFLDDIESVLLASASPGGLVRDLRVSSRAAAGAPVLPQTTPAPAPEDSPSATAPAAAGDDVLAHWQRVLGKDVRMDDDFFDAGGHSLQVLELVALVEANTGRQLDVAEWLDEPTPQRMAELLAPAGADDDPGSGPAAVRDSGPVTMREGEPGGPHLHLVHGAGVGRIPYRALVDALPADWRVTVSEDDGAGATTVEEMAERYLEPLLAGGRLPDLLGGWSMGGLLAHAMAAGLGRRGHRCPPLLLLDSPTPGAFTDADRGDLDAFARNVLRAADAAVRPPDRLRLERRAERGIGVLAGLLRAGGGEAPAEALHARYTLHARHVAAMSRYRDAAVADAPGLLVAADLTDEDVARWQRLFTTEPQTVRLPTDHYALLRGDMARRVADLVAGLLPATVR